MGQSIELLKQLTEKIPGGEYIAKRIEPSFVVPAGEAYARVESARGLLGCHVVSDGRSFPNRVAFRTPTVAALMAIPKVTQGIRIEDLPVVLASFDLSISEADR